MTLTRAQVLDYIQHAFQSGPITTEQMREVAAMNGAPGDVLVLLDRLPPVRLANPREIWPYLPDLPIGR